MLLQLVLSGHRDNVHPVPVKKEAHLLKVALDRSSEATGTVGFVALLTVTYEKDALSLFLVIKTE